MVEHETMVKAVAGFLALRWVVSIGLFLVGLYLGYHIFFENWNELLFGVESLSHADGAEKIANILPLLHAMDWKIRLVFVVMVAGMMRVV